MGSPQRRIDGAPHGGHQWIRDMQAQRDQRWAQRSIGLSTTCFVTSWHRTCSALSRSTARCRASSRGARGRSRARSARERSPLPGWTGRSQQKACDAAASACLSPVCIRRARAAYAKTDGPTYEMLCPGKWVASRFKTLGGPVGRPCEQDRWRQTSSHALARAKPEPNTGAPVGSERTSGQP